MRILEFIVPCFVSTFDSFYVLNKSTVPFKIRIEDRNMKIAVHSEQEGKFEFSLYDLSGRGIKELTTEYLIKGTHKLHVDVSGVSIGFYLVTPEPNGIYQSVRKTMILK